MKLIVDTADLAKIKEIDEFYPVDGVTTNPTIITRTNRPPFEVLREIREFLGEERELHVQVVNEKAEGIISEAHKITEKLGKQTFIKIPATKEGFKAMKVLSKEGFNITATTIYTALQAFVSAKCGAKYVAPYLNKIDNLPSNGIETVKQIQNIFDNNFLDCEVLAASFKNNWQVLALAEYGIGAATLAPDIFEGLTENLIVDSVVKVFNDNFHKTYGEGKTMEDFE